MSTKAELESKRQMLQMRAQIERLEMTGHVQAVKQELGWFAHAKRFFGFLGGRSLNRLGPIGAAGQQALNQVMGKNPYVGLAASALLLRLTPSASSRLIKAAAAATVLAGAVFWFRFKTGK
ncbi:MAG: hypothetical protein R3194_14210 [Limnobacter sp.]|nr:hypothetical protein [Limnobacter sp.]